MNAFELILLIPAIAVGVFVATATTVACSSSWGSRRREREIIRAFLRDPRIIEEWLTAEAIGVLEHDLAETERKREGRPRQPVRNAHRLRVVAAALAGCALTGLSLAGLGEDQPSDFAARDQTYLKTLTSKPGKTAPQNRTAQEKRLARVAPRS